MKLTSLIVIITIVAGMLLSVKNNKLTPAAGATGGLIAGILFIGAGYQGIILMASFFMLGVMATAWKFNKKKSEGLSEGKHGKRNTGQVLANAGAAAALSLWILFFRGEKNILLLMIAGAFSAATADTLSSELGNVYGKNFFHMLTFKPMQRGENGAVSVNGFLFGILGSVIIALIFTLISGWDYPKLFIIVIAGTAGNIADTLLGLTLEDNKLISNNIVNFQNTAVGAAVAGVLFHL